MATRRTKRILDPRTADEGLLTGKQCRDAVTRICSEAPIDGPEYQAATTVMKALDDLAGALTGNRELWWTKPHSTP